jgi:twitching motility protein PilI
MANTIAESPYQWLTDLEKRARMRARGLPREEKIEQFWHGITYRLGDVLLVTALTDIREILPRPMAMSKVPGAKNWVKGIANIRGLLLPVIDLHSCLEGNRVTPLTNRSRMLVINQSGVYSGLLVDEVLGLKHFPERLRNTEKSCKETWLIPFIQGSFDYEEQHWIIFDTKLLAENEKFLRAAS